jgi:hypothetical protein
MDAFIKPVMHYSTQVPDPGAVQAAYDDFLNRLK